MKTHILIAFISLCIFSCSSSSKDCSKYKGQDLIEDFDVEQISLNDDSYQKYIKDEIRGQQKEIDLKVSHDKDITTISFVKLGGHADIHCIEVITDRQKLDIINYESNYLKEITIRKVEYKIYNPDSLKLGLIDFKYFE